MEKTPSTLPPIRYWCFTCNKECTVEINADKDPQCVTCKSTFIEEITEDNKPQDYHPSLPPQTPNANINVATESQLIFLPSTVNCVVFNENQPLNGITSIFNSVGGIGGMLNHVFQSNIFLSNNLSNGNVPLLSFLSNHNNDTQFENLLNLIMTFEQNIRGHPPASDNAINNLEKVKVGQDNLEQFKDVECNICLTNFAIGDTVTKLHCSHEFHDNCIIHWLKMHNTCPVCRSELESNDPNYENRKNAHRETLRNFHSSNNNNNNNSGSTAI